MQKVLFKGETLEYRVYEYQNGKAVLAAQGKKKCQEIYDQGKDSRFACLNEMGLCLGKGQKAALKKKMQEYLIKNATVEDLFSLP